MKRPARADFAGGNALDSQMMGQADEVSAGSPTTHAMRWLARQLIPLDG
jgi:hypothetical protein